MPARTGKSVEVGVGKIYFTCDRPESPRSLATLRIGGPGKVPDCSDVPGAGRELKSCKGFTELQLPPGQRREKLELWRQPFGPVTEAACLKGARPCRRCSRFGGQMVVGLIIMRTPASQKQFWLKQ